MTLALSDTLDALIGRQDVPGGAAILFEGTRVIWAGAGGVRRVASAAQAECPFKPDTKLRVASISKLVTALVVHVLAERGALNLDGDCSSSLGFELRHPARPDHIITPAMLLSHTSGVRDGDDDAYQGIVGEALSDFFTQGTARWQGGRHWAGAEVPIGCFCYSNLAMGLLAQMAERITQARYDRLAKTLVLDPIGSRAGFNWSGVSDEEVRAAATLYRCPPFEAGARATWVAQMDAAPESGPRPTVKGLNGQTIDDYQIGSNGLLFSPQGGLRASVLDLARIGAVLGGAVPIVSEATRRRMFAPVWSVDAGATNGDTDGGIFAAFGSGVHLLLPSDTCPIRGLTAPLMGHYGSAYGLLAGLWVEPNTGKGFAYAVNGSHVMPQKSAHSGLFTLEDALMQAGASDHGLAPRSQSSPH